MPICICLGLFRPKVFKLAKMEANLFSNNFYKITFEVNAKLVPIFVGPQQIPTTSYNFFWPLSPNVQFEFVKLDDGEKNGCDGEDAGICGPSEEGLPPELMLVPYVSPLFAKVF